ncbi:hypothetical protein [Kitasatospora sp. NPDC091276]|uniref:hypothetical protein n=1 Tax=Kitasatospora sp. NPDC091276 TaxID=3155300 RepID=UPI00341FCEB3
MRQLDVESNYELIRRLDPYVKGAATGLPELAEATRWSSRAAWSLLVTPSSVLIRRPLVGTRTRRGPARRQ